MEFNSALADADGVNVLAIEGSTDGSFAVITEKNGKRIVKVFDEEGKLVPNPKSTAKSISEEDVLGFNIGSAVREDGNRWRLFSAFGHPLWAVNEVVDFVGDGNILVADGDLGMKLLSFGGLLIVKKTIACYEKFVNGCFVLTFIDGSKRMYSADGKSLSVEVRNAEFLPDGCFVHYDGNLLGGVYRPDGILDKREIYSFEKAGNYYLFSGEFYSGALYDDNGREIGRDYTLIKHQDNFCLFEHNGCYELFNQFGSVAKFSE